MSADGQWKLTITTPMGPQQVDASIATDGAAFTATLSGEIAGSQTVEGKADGDRLTWSMDITKPMPLTLDFDVTVSGDTLEGQAKLGMFGNGKVTGARA